MSPTQQLVLNALSYVGVIESSPNRSFVIDSICKPFGTQIKYCAAFISHVIQQTEYQAQLLSGFHTSALCHDLFLYNKQLLVDLPYAGCLVVWNHHVGIYVRKFNNDSFITIEGNTNIKGKVEGIFPRIRSEQFLGMKFLGYIDPFLNAIKEIINDQKSFHYSVLDDII